MYMYLILVNCLSCQVVGSPKFVEVPTPPHQALGVVVSACMSSCTHMECYADLQTSCVFVHTV